MWGYDLVTFWKLPNLTDRDLPHLDLPTSEKLANLGRINPRHCNDRRNLPEISSFHLNGSMLTSQNEMSPIVDMTLTGFEMAEINITSLPFFSGAPDETFEMTNPSPFLNFIP